jgi:hypothetical protein
MAGAGSKNWCVMARESACRTWGGDSSSVQQASCSGGFSVTQYKLLPVVCMLNTMSCSALWLC